MKTKEDMAKNQPRTSLAARARLTEYLAATGEEGGEEKGEGGADGLPEDQELQGEGEDGEKSAEKKGS